MTRDLIGYRVVAVHAHPDDESIATGGTLAQLARRGAEVTVITCTLGEEGEVIGETYAGLIADEADQLGGFRIGELTRALAHLGVRGEFLGGAGAFRDSGMVGSPAHSNPRAFVNSGDRAVELLAGRFLELNPQIVITYGPDGGYGHPDHIRAHEITHQAAVRVQADGVSISRIVWAVAERDDIDAAVDELTVVPEGWTRPGAGDLPAVDSSDAVVELTAADYHAKREAMRQHATQLWIADGSWSETNPHAAWGASAGAVSVFALSNLISQPLMPREHYQLGAGVPFSRHGADLVEGL